MIAPVNATINPAPVLASNSLIVISKSVGAPKAVASSLNEY